MGLGLRIQIRGRRRRSQGMCISRVGALREWRCASAGLERQPLRQLGSNDSPCVSWARTTAPASAGIERQPLRQLGSNDSPCVSWDRTIAHALAGLERQSLRQLGLSSSPNLGRWLHEIGLPSYAPTFQQAAIDGKTLDTLSEQVRLTDPTPAAAPSGIESVPASAGSQLESASAGLQPRTASDGLETQPHRPPTHHLRGVSSLIPHSDAQLTKLAGSRAASRHHAAHT